MSQPFGKNLKFYRTAKHMSQQELGERLGVAQRTVSNWESDKNEPNFETTIKILELFDVTFEDMMTE